MKCLVIYWGWKLLFLEGEEGAPLLVFPLRGGEGLRATGGSSGRCRLSPKGLQPRAHSRIIISLQQELSARCQPEKMKDKLVHTKHGKTELQSLLVYNNSCKNKILLTFLSFCLLTCQAPTDITTQQENKLYLLANECWYIHKCYWIGAQFEDEKCVRVETWNRPEKPSKADDNRSRLLLNPNILDPKEQTNYIWWTKRKQVISWRLSF